MTLQQLKYVTTVAQTGTISDAAKKLFISQPSLTKAVRELEKEMEITIFERTNRGIVISKEGETFLGYARQVLEQAALLEETYKKKAGHPVLISNEMIPDILAYDGENGLRGAIEKYAGRRVFVEVDDIGVLLLNQEDDELQSRIEEHNKSILHPILTFGIGHETPFFNARLKLLLFLIEDLNNVRKACDTMALSPGKAWDMINELEDKLGYTVVKRRRGGRNGGKTFLTEDGRQFLITCQRFEEQVISFSEQKFEKMFLESHMLEKKEEE
mgnify:CR=1 FL=1